MNIMLISPLPPPVGGIASWTVKYIKSANEHKINLFVVNTSIIGIRSYNLQNNVNMYDEIRRTKAIMVSMIRVVCKKKINIAHVNVACSRYGLFRDFLICFIAKILVNKVIVHYRCNIEDQVKSSFNLYILKLLTRVATENIVLNESSKKYLNKMCRHCIVVPNFIGEEFVLKNDKMISKSVKRIIFTGHLQHLKGINEIIVAAKYFTEKTFYLVGPVYENISNKITPNIVLCGVKKFEELISMLDDSDIFILPTYSEGFSNSILEAMGRGLPIITTTVGANIDMIDEFGGILIERENSDQLIDAIKLIEPRSIRERMSRWNVEKVNSDYTSSVVIEKILDIYKKCLKNYE